MKPSESGEYAFYQNDPKYRQYAAAIEKALKSFEYTSEWADLISALGKLNKLIQTHSKYGCIPKAVTVSKRLSQCMHPALPFGVHLKALECYKQIFDSLGTLNLGRDLCMYSIGLFPLYANATINVRRSLLELYEKYFVALGPLLKPALIGFLNGLLPGLEEGSEFYDRLIELLNQIHAGVGSLYFYSCLWECVYSTPGIRLPALLYVCSQLDRKKSIDDQLDIVGSSIDRMVDSLCAAGSDGNILVQRQLLDFVNTAFPLNSHNLLRSDLLRLVESCLFVVLKRDMSLNRRLYSWLLGPKNELEYFEHISKPLVVEAVLNIIDTSHKEDTIRTGSDYHTKFFRLLLYLLDKPDVGRPLVHQLLSPLLLDLVNRKPSQEGSSGDTTFENTLKVLGLLLDALKPGFIWEYLNSKIKPLLAACMEENGENSVTSPRLIGYLDVVDLFLENKDLLNHSDNNGQYTSEFLVQLLDHLSHGPQSYDGFNDDQLSLCNRYLETVIGLLSAVLRISPPIDLSAVIERLENESKELEEQSNASSVIDGQLCFETCRQSAASILTPVVRLFLDRTPNQQCINLLTTLATLLKNFADLPVYTILDIANMNEESTASWVSDLCCLCFTHHFDAQRQSIELLLHVYGLWKSIVEQRRLALDSLHNRRNSEKPITFSVVLKPLLPENCDLGESFFKELANSLWGRLNASTPEYHDEATRLFLFLHSVLWDTGQDGCGDSVCVSLVMERMTSDDDEASQAEAARRFCVLWSLGRRHLVNSFLPGYPCRPLIRPALLLLDNLQSDTPLGQLAQGWYDDTVDRGDLPTLLHSLCIALAQPSMARLSVQSVKIIPILSQGPNLATLAYRLDDHSISALFHQVSTDFTVSDFSTHEPARSSTAEGQMNDMNADAFNDDEAIEIDESVAATFESNGDGIVEDYEISEAERRSASSACSASAVVTNTEMTTTTAISTTTTGETAVSGQTQSISYDTSSSSLNSPILFYRQRFDSARLIHIFRLLSRMVNYAPRRFVETLLSAGSPVSDTTGELSYLLSCNQNSMAGFTFGDGSHAEKNNGCRSPSPAASMYFESLLTLSLYFVRSYYVNDPAQKISVEHVQSNCYLKRAVVQFLASTVRVIGDICDDGGRSVSAYVADVLSRCKLQKCVLHCLMTMVKNQNDENYDFRQSFIDSVTNFNSSFLNSKYVSVAYEGDLLKLLEAIVHVEYRIRNAKADFSASGIILDKLSVNAQVSPVHAARQAAPVASQKLFLYVVLNALKHAPYSSHDSWLRFIIRCLPYMEKTLPTVLLHACEQLCKNLVYASQFYNRDEVVEDTDEGFYMPVNYVTNILESMTILCHFALLDSMAGCLPSSTQLGGASTTESSGSNGPAGTAGKAAAAGEVFGNLARVFAFGDVTMAQALAPSGKDGTGKACIQAARQQLLAALPHMLSTLFGLWAAAKGNQEPSIPVGSPQRVRRLILELLNPVAVNQTRHFLSALAMVWLSRSSDKKDPNKAFTDSQLELVEMLMCIKMLPFEKLIAGIFQTLKQPLRAKNTDEKDAFPLEISLLEMASGVQTAVPLNVVKTSWAALQQLIVDGLSVVTLPSSRFLLFKFFYVFVSRVQSVDDKSSRKEAQDACQKLVENVNDIVAWHLEQPTWLKRSLVVKQDGDGDNEKIDALETVNGTTGPKHTALWSAKALNVFAEHLATVLDLLYKNEEKDRMIPILNAVWTNVLPYLKTRTPSSRRHFQFASKFLANLSQYSQTRPVWRTATMELLLEPTFFNCGDLETFKEWSVIVDNLMTQDKTSFKLFLTKAAVSQSGGIFTSREQEYDSRGAALKRLAFVLLSSDLDQYQPYLPDVQERLTENLRLYQVPHVCADVFLCFRVLLIRLSPHHLLPLWPTMITETMQVLLLIEQELRGGSGNDEYRTARDDQWLLLYVAAAKFLDALSKLPPSKLPQFQMYQWVFMTTIPNEESHQVNDKYTPQVERISHLMQEKYGKPRRSPNGSSSPIPFTHASSLKDLQPFFTDLCDAAKLHEQAAADASRVRKEIEEALYEDLLAAV